MTIEALEKLNATAADTVALLSLIAVAADNATAAIERLAEAQANIKPL